MLNPQHCSLTGCFLSCSVNDLPRLSERFLTLLASPSQSFLLDILIGFKREQVLTYLQNLESNRGLLAGWNSGLGLGVGCSRNNGLATLITSSDEEPTLESALECSLDRPHTHLSSSAKVKLVNVEKAIRIMTAESGIAIPETKDIIQLNIATLWQIVREFNSYLVKKPSRCTMMVNVLGRLNYTL